MRQFPLIILLLIVITTRVNAQVKVIIQNGHTAPVTDICFGGTNDEYLFTGSKDGSIKIWDSKEGVLINTLSGRTTEIRGLMMNKNRYLISVDNTGRITWWDFYRQKEVYTRESDIENAQIMGQKENKKYLIFYCNDETNCREKNNFDVFNTLNNRWIKINDSLSLHDFILYNNRLAGISDDRESITMLDLTDNKKPAKRTLHEEGIYPMKTTFISDGNCIAVLYSDSIIRSYITKVPNSTGPSPYRASVLKVPVDAYSGISSDTKQRLSAWSGNRVFFFTTENTSRTSFSVSFDTTVIDVSFIDSVTALVQLKYGLVIADLRSQKTIRYKNYKTPLSCWSYSAAKKLFAFVESGSSTAQVIDRSTGSYAYSLTSPIWETSYLQMHDSLHMQLVSKDGGCRMLNVQTGRITEPDTCTTQPDETDLAWSVQSVPEGSLFSFLVTIETIDSVEHTVVTSRKQVHEGLLKGATGIAKSLVMSLDNNRVFMLDGEGKIIAYKKLSTPYKYYDLVFEKEFTSIPFQNENWAIIFPDNLYACSKESLRWMMMRNGMDDYSIEELDLFYNRPDVVLRRLGSKDSTLISIYKKAFEKRLKRNGFDTTILGQSIYRPYIDIKDPDRIPASTESDFIEIEVTVSSHKTPLKSLHVFVNEVPVYGSGGISLQALKTRKNKQYLRIPLSYGSNEIKLQAMDTNNIHGMYSRFHIYCNKDRKEKNLYVVVVSVSRYKDAAMNLKYARKDGHDFANMMLEAKRYKHVFIDTLFDEEATRTRIESTKIRLLKSHPEDDVVLYFSGHGVLDSTYSFYFATHDIDFRHPEISALPYDRIEWLLDSIPAHNKLLLLDACHSGEVDRDEMKTSDKQVVKNDAKDIKKYKGSELINQESVHIGMQNTFELMNEMFSGLSSTNGAIVISASAGNSFAFESDEWKNGVFTYCILNGLRTGAADLNHDGEITVLELKKYTGKKVEILTHGKQKPTSRMENSRFDWVIF